MIDGNGRGGKPGPKTVYHVTEHATQIIEHGFEHERDPTDQSIRVADEVPEEPERLGRAVVAIRVDENALNEVDLITEYTSSERRYRYEWYLPAAKLNDFPRWLFRSADEAP
jgi:hypothetical protein